MPYATNSSGNYSGTIITSPVRPISPNSNIATLFSNEIKGNHHTYETLIERNSIPESRRDWGMLCTVYNDTILSNNKTYILRQVNSSNVLDNTNWVEFVTGATNFVPTGGEWINSVQIISATPSVLTDGYRYLVSSGGIGQFSGQDWKIAQYNLVGSTFSFVVPTEGMTIRVDNEPNVIYKYQGVYSTGKWVKEYLNQVRYLTAYSTNGMSYSATSSQTPLTNYSDCIYYVKFNMTSSGTVSINVDSLGHKNIKKLENNNFNFLVANDVVPDVTYELFYNSDFLQTVLPSSTTTTIGSPEDGTYTDGLFTDFNSSTPIGFAIDRINEALKTLFGLTGFSGGSSSSVLPFAGPTLSSWSATGSFVEGGLSFDSSNPGFVSATSSPYGSVGRNQLFSSLRNAFGTPFLNPYRLGITSKVLQPLTGTTYYRDISGSFNSGVTATSGYSASSFGYASSGTFSLILNGVTISSVSLSTLSPIDTTSNNAISGLSFSAVSSSGIFSPAMINRTGSYLIKRDDPNIVDGYNYFFGRHDFDGNSHVLPRYEFIADSSTQSVTDTNSFSRFNLTYISPHGYLSGIQYYGQMNIKIDNNALNMFSNTFYWDLDARFLREISFQLNPTNSVTISPNQTPPAIAAPFMINDINGINPLANIRSSTSPSYNIVNAYEIRSISNRRFRLLNGFLGFRVDYLKTVQGTMSGATFGRGGLFFDNFLVYDQPTLQTENFSTEKYRKLNGSSKYDTIFNSYSSMISATYSSSDSLLTNNGLQVINGSLLTPVYDFSTAGTSPENPNFGIPSRNYANARFFVTNGHGTTNALNSQFRTYTRYFETTTLSTNFLFGIRVGDPLALSNSIMRVDNANSGDQIWMEMRAYNNTTAITPWYSFHGYYTGISLGNGSPCLTQPNQILPNILNLFFTIGNVTPTNKIVFRITAGPDWSNYLTRITLSSR